MCTIAAVGLSPGVISVEVIGRDPSCPDVVIVETCPPVAIAVD